MPTVHFTCPRCGTPYATLLAKADPFPCFGCGDWLDPAAIAISQSEPARTRGGARPGAGAPKGNLNRLNTGRSAKGLAGRVQRLAARDPLSRKALIAFLAELEASVPPAAPPALRNPLKGQQLPLTAPSERQDR